MVPGSTALTVMPWPALRGHHLGEPQGGRLDDLVRSLAPGNVDRSLRRHEDDPPARPAAIIEAAAVLARRHGPRRFVPSMAAIAGIVDLVRPRSSRETTGRAHERFPRTIASTAGPGSSPLPGHRGRTDHGHARSWRRPGRDVAPGHHPAPGRDKPADHGAPRAPPPPPMTVTPCRNWTGTMLPRGAGRV